MKKFYLSILSILLLSTSSFSQLDSQTEKQERQQLKNKLAAIKQAGFEVPEAYKEKAAGFGTADYGEAPDWEWIEKFGGSGKDIVREVAVAADGRFYTTGSFSGEMSIGTNNYTSLGRRDAFLAKFQSDGTLIWFKQFSPSAANRIDAFGIHLDGDDIFITGYYSGDVNFGGIELPGTHEMNLFLVRTNTDGEVGMAINHPTSNEKEIGLKVDTDDNGNIFVLGSTDGTTNFKHPSVIIKYTANGSVLLDYYHDQNFCDMQVMDENIYFLGTINTPDSIGDFFLEPSIHDAFVAKSNTNMVFDWVEMAKHYSIHGSSLATEMFVSPDETLFFTGSFLSSIIWGDFEISGRSGFVTKCDSNGDFQWLNETGTYDADGHTAICANEENTFVSLNSFLVKAFDISNGSFLHETILENNAETINDCPTDHSLLITQDADELIRISNLDASTLNTTWTVLFGGNSAQSYCIGMDADEDGFLYNFGYTTNQIDYFGQTIDKGLFLAKQDHEGAIVWTKQFNNSNIDYWILGDYFVVDTIMNNVYICGEFSKPFYIPDGPTLIPDPDGSIFIMKYDFDGNFQWAIQEDFKSRSLAITTDFSGNIVLSGYFEQTIDIGNSTLHSAGSEDVFIAKYNDDGVFVWAKRAGGEEEDWDGYVSTDGQDNVYLTGEFLSQNITVDDYSITLNEGDGNVLFAKFDSQGNVQWVTVKAGSTISPDADYLGFPTGIQTNFEGESYIKGWHNDSAYFDNIVLASLFNPPSPRIANKFIAKFDTEGNTIWAKSISEYSPSYFYNQFDIDYLGNVYAGLRVRGDTSLFGEDFMYLKSGLYDLLVFKYTNEGELDWVKSIEGSDKGSCWLSSVAAVDPVTTYVCGWFTDYLDFGTISFTVNNKNGFIGLLDKTSSITVYQRHELPFTLFPNPAKQMVNIRFQEATNDETEIRVTDINGKTISSMQIASGRQSFQLDLSGFTAGVYLVHLKSAKESGVKKLVVE